MEKWLLGGIKTFNQKNLFGRSYKVHHGSGRHIRDPSYEKVLDPEVAEKFRDQYDPKKTKCYCGFDLVYEDILYYVPDSGGWPIPQETELAWLYVNCPKCGYDMSLWKMGVPRNYEP